MMFINNLAHVPSAADGPTAGKGKFECPHNFGSLLLRPLSVVMIV
jgi:hypothetical protein